MGTYRLLLAILVLLSHLGISVGGHNIGVVAVVSFFLISGFVMTALIRKSYSAPSRIGYFYLDRAMRLFPQYLVYLIATLVSAHVVGLKTPFVTDLSATKVAMNAMMVPVGFYMYGLEDCMLIPQAWSLGLEATFYLAIPILLIYRLRFLAFAVSAAIFAFAYWGAINTDVWGYRLLPGTLFIFLCGSLLKEEANRYRAQFLLATLLVVVALLAALLIAPTMQKPFNFEVLLGIAIGLPMVWVLHKVKLGRLDDALGNVSYGVFLNHFLLIWLFEALSFPATTPTRIAVLVCCSIALGWLTYITVESPVVRMRHAMRQQRPGIETAIDIERQPAGSGR